MRAARIVAAVTGALGLADFSEHARSRAVGSHPAGPLTPQAPLPTISVIVPVGALDAEVAACSIVTSLPNIGNPIRTITIAAPMSSIGDDVRADVLGRAEVASVDVCVDNDLLGSSDLTAIERFPASRRGWVRQQAVKLALAARSQDEGVLILDADTTLLRQRVFLDENHVGLLMPTYELHLPYYAHLGRVFGVAFARPLRGWSHVSHHLLMQPPLVRDMLQEVEARHGKPPIAAMIGLADPTESAACCLEYETYAEWCLRRAPARVREVLWGNLAVPRSRAHGPSGGSVGPFSISRHHYDEK